MDYNQQPIRPPDTKIVFAVLSVVIGAILVFSCYFTIFGIPSLVLGILALVNGNNAEKQFFQGNPPLAEHYAKSARNYANIGFWIAIGSFTLMILGFISVIMLIAVNQY